MQKLITLFLLLMLGHLNAVQAQCPSGTLGGSVYNDINYDGVDNDTSSPISGIKIYLFDAAGAVDSTTTLSDGTFTFTGKVDGDPYRIEFHAETQGYSGGPFGADSKTTLQFVTAPACDITEGLVYPAAFCSPDPLVFTPCYVNGNPNAGGSAGDTTGLVAVQYSASGPGQGANINIAKTDEVGALWGMSYQSETGLLFASATLKRHTGFGPNGTGAIYVYDVNTPAASTKIATIDLDALGVDTGTDPRIVEPLPTESINPSHDVGAYGLVGKMSLGDLDISDDGKYLYVTNLFDRTVYEIFIDNPFVQPTAADVTPIPLANPGCGADTDWRPWGLEYHMGELYAGVVCSAEGSQDTTQLRAFVQKLNTTTNTFDTFFDMGLTFERGYSISNDPNINNWRAWSDDYTLAFNNFALNYPQPILSDIAFEEDGSMILGFMDRMGMQGGFENFLPDPNLIGAVNTYSAGDLIKVCNINGILTLEGATGCETAGGLGNGQGPGGDEFFYDDRYENSITNPATPPFVTHQETSLGGIYAKYGSGEVATIQYDPLDFNTGGIGYFNTTTGTLDHNYEVFPNLPGYSGKSAGLGDIDAGCPGGPIEKGNFVWVDTNEDGIQDPGEPGLPGVNVSLYTETNGVCNQLVTIMTDANGEYYFTDVNVPGGIQPNVEYFIVIGESGQFDMTTLQLFDSLSITLSNVGTWVDADRNDSDGELILGPNCFDNLPHTSVTIDQDGVANHACDFGFFVACDIEYTAVASVDETCEGDTNGSITVTATTTDPVGVEYNIDGGAFGPSGTFTNLANGAYYIIAQVVGEPSCALDTLINIQPGLFVPLPTDVEGFGICRNEAVPASEGLKATCAPCPAGFTDEINWFDAPTGGNLVGTGSPFDPVAAGAVDASIAGTTTFYVECGCGPCKSSSRPTADFTVFDLPTPTIAGDTLPCPGNTVTYIVALNPGSTYTWSLSGGGTIISQNNNEITIEWDATGNGGTFVLTVTESDANGCSTTVSTAICIRDLTLVCNDLIQVSVTEDCKASVNFDILLEGTYKTTDGFTVTIEDMNGNLITNGMVGLGMYKFTVKEPCGGNSCWGEIKAEDKLAPEINCQPLSLPCSYTDTSVVLPDLTVNPTFAPIGGGIGGVIITDNCSLALINYTDQYHPFDCDTLNGVLAGNLIRTWYAEDNSGNTATCVQEISFTRAQLSAISFPTDITVSCENPGISPNVTGIPTILGNPVWPSSGFCNFEVTYTDQIIPICDGTTKYLRTWQAIDWCLPLQSSASFQNPVTYIQVIKVEDTKAPVFNCPSDMTVSATSDCTVQVDLPDVMVEDACSRIRYAKAYIGTEEVTGNLVTFPSNNLWTPDTLARFGILSDLPSGKHTVEYRITDDCGNAATCSFEVAVDDGAPPLAICDAHTQVALGGDGTQRVFAKTFDDGSFDNCADVFFKTRRMDANTCDDSSEFDDTVTFCCSDVGDTVRVVMRVYDQEPSAGVVSLTHLLDHSDECMVTATVVDKIKPYIGCPPNVEVTCEAFDPTLWAHGQATAEDNCALDTLTTTTSFAQFDTVCNVGRINRRFTAIDIYGNTSSCTQSVTVTRVSDYMIKFPNDVVHNTCDGTYNTDGPIITNETCEQIGIGYTDEILTLIPDACFKILRTWRVEDGCLYDANFDPTYIPNPISDDEGVEIETGNFQNYAFEYTQIIKVLDGEKPVILDCPASPLIIEDLTDNDPLVWNANQYWDPNHQSHDLCEIPNGLSISAFDSCSGTNISARYLLFVDFNGDADMETVYVSGEVGSPVIEKSTQPNAVTFSIDNDFQLPHGTHKIKWAIYDGCGNEETCEYLIHVVDAKKPTIVCKNGFTAEVMQTGDLNISQNLFIEYAFDNCTPADQLEFAIQLQGAGTTFPTTTSLNFNCADIGTQFVEIWVRDKAGNEDFCVTYVIIQDNMGVCNVALANVAGALLTTDVEGVQEAFVEITGQSNVIPVPGIMTAYDGRYNFTAVPMGDDYVITPAKTDDWTNGVNTYDLLLIQKHLLGVQPFNSPFKMIAADVNNTGSITPSDIISIRRMIMGIDDAFPNNDSWRFVDESYVFSDPSNPFVDNFPENLTYGDLQQNVSSGDFTSIKIGDLNGSAHPNNLVIPSDRTKTGALVFDVNDTKLAAGETAAMHFNATDLSAYEGFQFTISFDAAALELTDVAFGNLDHMTSENMSLERSADGLIQVSWNDLNVAKSANSAFTLEFLANKATSISESVQISNALLQAEAYTATDEHHDVALRFDGKMQVNSGFELLQNKPNPFAASTIIGFYLPEASTATLQIFDMTGRTVKTVKGQFTKGYNAVRVVGDELPVGALFYRVETEFGTAERKMIRN